MWTHTKINHIRYLVDLLWNWSTPSVCYYNKTKAKTSSKLQDSDFFQTINKIVNKQKTTSKTANEKLVPDLNFLFFFSAGRGLILLQNKETRLYKSACLTPRSHVSMDMSRVNVSHWAQQFGTAVTRITSCCQSTASLTYFLYQ